MKNADSTKMDMLGDSEEWVACNYGDVFFRQSMSPAGERLVIGPSRGHVDLMLALARTWRSQGFYVLYVLLISHTGAEPGRYQSPCFDSFEDLQIFFHTYERFLESDGRHHVWIGSPDGGGVIVYDQHNVIFAYGDLPAYERVLADLDFKPKKFWFPLPHRHDYPATNASQEEELLKSLPWRHSPSGMEMSGIDLSGVRLIESWSWEAYLNFHQQMNADIPLVLLAPRMTDDSKAVWKTCLDLGWSVERIQGWRVPDHLVSMERPVVIYGEPLFAEAVADQLGLVLLEPSIDWLTTVPRGFLRRDMELMTLGEARERPAKAFVKPADGKIFEPKVYACGADLPTEEHVDAGIPVLRSGIVDFRLEVRCFVKNRRVVTLSPYWREGELAMDEHGQWPFMEGEGGEALRFAKSVLGDSRIDLPPACTLDVGRLSDGYWAVIEANPCWGAGLYGCDPREVLYSIREAVLPRGMVTDGDRRWVSKRRTAIHQ